MDINLIIKMKYLPFLFILSFIILTSCSKQESEISDSELHEQIEDYRKILGEKLNLIGTNITVDENYVILDDILFERTYLDQISSKKAIAVTSTVSHNNVRNIDVFIANGFTQNQQNLIGAAIANWNNIVRSGINLNIVNSNNNADLTIAPDNSNLLPQAMRNLPQQNVGCNGVHGVAWFSNNHKVGRWISINEDLAIRTGNVQFRLTVQHEIGHTLGFAHGNQGEFQNLNIQQGNGQPGSFTAERVSCTLLNQANNLMEGAAACNLNGFSADELLAAEYLYPAPQIINEVEAGIMNDACINGDPDLSIGQGYCSFDGGQWINAHGQCYNWSVSFCCMR